MPISAKNIEPRDTTKGQGPTAAELKQAHIIKKLRQENITLKTNNGQLKKERDNWETLFFVSNIF